MKLQTLRRDLEFLSFFLLFSVLVPQLILIDFNSTIRFCESHLMSPIFLSVLYLSSHKDFLLL